jgi:hypothetical protein
MAYTHGHNYTYLDSSNNEETFFPVAWDLRGTFYELRDYYQYYQGYALGAAESAAESFINGILSEAMSYGVNTLIIRVEPRKEAEAFLENPVNTIERAEQARDIGMNVILGGIKSGGGTQDEGLHNRRVFDYWELYWNDYIEQNSPPPGDFCGVFAHDEPDNLNYEHYDEVASIALRLIDTGGVPSTTGLDLPLGAALAKVGDLDLETDSIRNWTSMLLNPLTNWRSTPFVFGHPLDYISLNYYPALITGVLFSQSAYPEENPTDDAIVLFRGAADLVPSDGAFRAAYCDRDEYFALRSNGNLSVYTIEGSDELGEPSFQFHSTTDIGISLAGLNYSMAASDNRSADIGSRSGFTAELNGGLVFWRKGESIDYARAVYWHSNAIVSKPFPSNSGYDSEVFCVGELDYRSGWSSNQNCSGVIGSDEMRILWVGSPQQIQPTDSQWRARIFGRDSSGDLYACPTQEGLSNITLPEGFYPDGAIWGYFWRQSGDYPFFRSGFILYTTEGQYVLIRTLPMASESWQCSQVYTDLWGEGMMVGPVTVTRDINNLQYFSRFVRTHDRFIAMVSPVTPSQGITKIVWSSIATQPPIPVESEYISEETPALPRAENLTSLSIQNYGYGHKIKLYVNDDSPNNHGVRTRYTEAVAFPFIEAVKFPIDYSNDWRTLCEIRSRHTRFSESDVLTDKNPGIYMWSGQTVTEIPEILFENMYSRPTSANSQELGALDIMLEYGVNQPATAECLFLTVQCHGRGSFFNGTFFPGDGVMGYDELMYTMGAALVHGIRGFNLYGLDLALSGGPAFPTASYRFPPELLYWGASVDGPNDIDMVTRTHEAVQTFTCVDEGNNSSFNLLGVLVNPAYEVMDSTEAVNATISFSGGTVTPAPEEPYLNFLALKEPDGDILVLLSTDGESWSTSDCLMFPDISFLEYYDYGDPEVLLGDRVISMNGGWAGHMYPDGYYLYPEVMNCSFALVRIPASGIDHQGGNTSTLVEQSRSLTVNRNTGPSVLVEAQGAEVQIFDLTGRVVDRIAPGECLELSSCVHPAGVYFAVLSEEDTPLYIEKLVLLDGGR